MEKRLAGVVFFVGVIIRWYRENFICMRHGVLLAQRYSQWVPKDMILLMCPDCERAVRERFLGF